MSVCAVEATKARTDVRDCQNCIERTMHSNALSLLLSSAHVTAARVMSAVSEGACVNSTSTSGQTACHLAALWKNDELMALLINEYGADVVVRACHGETPLHVATESGALTIVSMLLAHGAKGDVECAVGWQTACTSR